MRAHSLIVDQRLITQFSTAIVEDLLLALNRVAKYCESHAGNGALNAG